MYIVVAMVRVTCSLPVTWVDMQINASYVNHSHMLAAVKQVVISVTSSSDKVVHTFRNLSQRLMDLKTW